MFVMKSKCETIYASIHMSGDSSIAKHFIQGFVNDFPDCVQVYDCEYIYTGGRENGFVARIINYPKFERSYESLKSRIFNMSHDLADKMNVASYSIEMNGETFYFENTDIKK